MPATIYFTVTNDLSTDQRMHRITKALANAGYTVHLVGRKLPDSKPVHIENVYCHRLDLLFTKGKLFYLEYNIRLFWFLLFSQWDAVCSIDLDTISAAFTCALLKGKKRIYDAH